MAEENPRSEEQVEDLDVPESESEDVKGGLLPAVDPVADKFNKFSPNLGGKVGSRYFVKVERF